jgi:hypothetical protein
MGEVSTIGVDLAKSVFVRPASRVSFCFTGGDIAWRNRLFHQPFPTQTCGAGNSSV